jgi:hypothetical protein
MPSRPVLERDERFRRQRLELCGNLAAPLREWPAVVQVGQQPLGCLGLLPLRPVPRLRLLAHALQPAVDVLAIGHDQLEAERLEVGRGVGVLREAVEDREQRIGLAELTRDLGAAGHVDDADRGPA